MLKFVFAMAMYVVVWAMGYRSGKDAVELRELQANIDKLEEEQRALRAERAYWESRMEET